MNTIKAIIPSYPCDKVMFPGAQLSPDSERESTTFCNNFMLAEATGGLKSVKETFNLAFKEWKNNIKYLTEIAVVTNQLGWYHYNRQERELADFYFSAYHKCCGHVYQADSDGNNTGPFTDEEVIFFHAVLD